MAGESDQTRWVGTRKVDPAIADLQAIKAPHNQYVIWNNQDCSVVCYITGTRVAAGEINVITNITGINFDSLCDMVFYVRAGGVTRRLAGIYGVEPNTAVPWSGQIWLVETDYIMIGFELGGVSDDLRVTEHGYIIGAY